MMPKIKQKTRVTVIAIPQKHITSRIHKKRRHRVSIIKVTPDSRHSSFNGNDIIRSAQYNEDRSNVEKQTMPNYPNLEEANDPSDQYKSKTFSSTSLRSIVTKMRGTSSLNSIKITRTKRRRSTGDKSNVTPETSSSKKMLTRVMNYDGASNNSSRVKLRGDYQEQESKERSRRSSVDVTADKLKKTVQHNEKNTIHKITRRYIGKIYAGCSICCCISTCFGILLLLMGITALLVFLLTNKQTTTVTTTTSTTATSTSTTTTSTTTTPAPPCVPTSVGSANSLYTTSSSSTTAYTCFAYEWTSPTTGLVTLAFNLRHDPDYWYLDDVLVYAGVVQMLSNTGFETSNLSPWIRTTPNGACGGAPAAVCNFGYHSGNYSACDGSNGCADRLSQQFMATSGEIYIVSFWLKSGSTGSVISANITLS
ncbi:unnamed protein product [Rotaria magnacalcarata]|uniref:Uncharacterized protein n=6 Tax=Rotaria magnacalcarata TaxID=392030 RepID=A0A815BZ58_9BILA|nr:unnamed protein product [Rotaria magnacalcarata]